jgi:hypothetical protein
MSSNDLSEWTVPGESNYTVEFCLVADATIEITADSEADAIERAKASLEQGGVDAFTPRYTECNSFNAREWEDSQP